MPAIFSKNCIMKGDVDSYCLVCSTGFYDEEDVLAHIQTPTHKTSLKAVAYYEKLKDDFIKKVNAVYFCELCNETYTTAARVVIHVASETHAERKRTQIRRVGKSIVFQKNIMIEERAWNGLVEETCVACNADFDDHSTHLSEPMHILNVIRKTVTIDSNNNIYRKVEGGYQCLTCNTLISGNFLTEHMKSTDHNSAIVKGDLSHYTGSDEIKAGGSVEKKTEKEVKSGEIVKDTDMRLNVKCAYEGPHSSSRPLVVKDKQISPKSISKEVEIFAKQHGLSINEFNNTVQCTICLTEISGTLNCVKEHVLGKNHKKKSLKQPFTSKPDKKTYEKTKLNEFITKIHRDENTIIINEQFVLTIEDFFGFSMLTDKLFCEFCHVDLNLPTFSIHVLSTEHKNKMDNSYVISSLDSEFVRQVSPDLYHCGFCGNMESDFDDMMDHLNTTEHKTLKIENQKLSRTSNYDVSNEYNNLKSFLASFFI